MKVLKIAMKVLKIVLYGVFCYVLGSMLFWLPDVSYHFFRGGTLRGIDYIILTAILPGIVALGWLLLAPRTGGLMSGLLVSAIMMLGILTACPFWTSVNATLAGGGFAAGLTWQQLRTWTLWFPLVGIDLFTYDGTLFAIGVCMLWLLLLPIIRYVSRRTEPEPRAISVSSMAALKG